MQQSSISSRIEQNGQSLAVQTKSKLLYVLRRILFAQWFYGLALALILFCTAQSAAPSTGTDDCSSSVDEDSSSVSAEVLLKFESSYKRAWQLIRDNTLYPERLKNWSDWEHKFDGRITTTKQLEEAIALMLSALGDQYTYFRNSADTQSWHSHDEENSVVSAYKMPSNVAYVAIHSFSSLHTAEELESALQQMQDASAYILDLRANRGGYVEQALASFELVADEGLFVSMSGREDGKPYCEILKLQTYCVKRSVNGSLFMESRKKNLCGTKPITVLVDQDTRSAAEMLAGALRDNKRAKLAGCRTYGKGIVQSSWMLEPECSIKIAMAHYYLPSGEDINGIGLRPDLLIDFASTKLNSAEEATCRKPLNNAQLQQIMPIFQLQASSDQQHLARN